MMPRMSEKAMSDALSAIHDEAARLLGRSDIPEDARKTIELILSIARYKIDVRGNKERE
jgi:hypothetical protein